MTNKQKEKGTRFESGVVAYFNEHGYPHVERRALAGNVDKGDIAGIPGVVLECKATKNVSVGPHMGEAELERKNANADFGAVVWKRPQKPVADAAVILPLSQFVRLLKEAGR